MSNFTAKKRFTNLRPFRWPQTRNVSNSLKPPPPFLKSFARRQRRSRVGSTGRFKLNSSTTAANRATKSMMLKGVLQNFTSPGWMERIGFESEFRGNVSSLFCWGELGGNKLMVPRRYLCLSKMTQKWSRTKFGVASMSAWRHFEVRRLDFSILGFMVPSCHLCGTRVALHCCIEGHSLSPQHAIPYVRSPSIFRHLIRT